MAWPTDSREGINVRRTVVIITAILLIFGALAAADTVELIAVADVNTHSGGGGNTGSSQIMLTGSVPGGYEMRSLVAFDTSAIPAGSRINSAEIMTYNDVVLSYSGANAVLAAFSPLGSWDEMTVVWSNQPAMGPQVSANTVTLDPGNTGRWLSWDVTGAYANDEFLDFYVAQTNLGESVQYGQFSTRESFASSRPRLAVDYTRPEDIPEPCTLALVGLGLGGLILKRRRAKA